MRDARCGIWIRSTHGFSPMVIKIGLYALKSWSFAISPCFKLAGTSFVLAMFTETVSVSQLAFLKKSVAVFNVSRVIAFTTILPLTVNFFEQTARILPISSPPPPMNTASGNGSSLRQSGAFLWIISRFDIANLFLFFSICITRDFSFSMAKIFPFLANSAASMDIEQHRAPISHTMLLFLSLSFEMAITLISSLVIMPLACENSESGMPKGRERLEAGGWRLKAEG